MILCNYGKLTENVLNGRELFPAHQCEFIVNVYLSGYGSPQWHQSSLFATGKLHERINNGEKPTETGGNMWERKKKVAGLSPQESRKVYLFRAYLHNSSFLFTYPLCIVLNLTVSNYARIFPYKEQYLMIIQQ